MSEDKYPPDWEKWMPEISRKLDQLAIYEEQVREQIREMHDVIYKNGLSHKVSTLWEWRRDINKVIITLIVAMIVGLGGFIWQSVTRAETLEKQLNMINHQLEKLQGKKP